MKTKFSTKFIALLFFLGIALVSCTPSPPTAENNGEPITIYTDAEYVSFTKEDMLEQADIILVGRVTHISQTKWNQDNGEYWQETTQEGVTESGDALTTTHSAWPIHEITISVVEPLVGDDITLGENILLTILGKSPLDNPSQADEIVVQVGGDADHTLQLGDEIVLFATRTEIAWRDPNQPIQLVTNEEGLAFFDIGTRDIISFIGVPFDSYLIKGEDGLFYGTEETTQWPEPLSSEQLLGKIGQERDAR